MLLTIDSLLGGRCVTMTHENCIMHFPSLHQAASLVPPQLEVNFNLVQQLHKGTVLHPLASCYQGVRILGRLRVRISHLQQTCS